jgi:hypothetical protein
MAKIYQRERPISRKGLARHRKQVVGVSTVVSGKETKSRTEADEEEERPETSYYTLPGSLFDHKSRSRDTSSNPQ